MDCIFCKIAEGALPSKKVYECDQVVAFEDISPKAPVHVLIIPKVHIPTMNDVEGEEQFQLIAKIHEVAQVVAQKLGIAESGYRLVNNCGKDSGQIVFHLHYHLLGGESLGDVVGPKA